MAKFLSKDGKFYMRDGKLLHPTNILEVPIVATNLTYNGNAQSPAIYGYNENTMTMGGVTSGINAGNYEVTFTPKSGYEWSDGSTTTKNITWKIERATISIPYFVTNTLVYTGDVQSPQYLIGYNSQKMSRGGTTAAVNAGHYAATFTPYDNYQWPGGDTGTIEVGWLIYKAAGSLSLSTNSLIIDANSTTGSFTVTRAGDGAISASSNNTSVATVSVSGNTVTVTKVGQGSATITVSVAEGTNHTAPESKTCTVTTSFKTTASTAATSGVNYTSGLPTDWNIMKEIGMAISEASGSINANTTGSVYVNKGNMWAYKITPGNTINITSQIGTYTYAVMGFNNFALSNQANYGGTHTTAGVTFGAVDCVGRYQLNPTNLNEGGWGQCPIRTSTMPTLQQGMPNTLAQVKVPYVNRGQSTILYSDDYMFFPAEKEVFGTRKYSPEAEANALTQFAYYKNGGSTIKKVPGSPNDSWWLRSVG